MKIRIFLLTMLLAFFMASSAWSLGDIWGHITYKNCECNGTFHTVIIDAVDVSYYLETFIECAAPGGPVYDTNGHPPPPGKYHIYVDFGGAPGACDTQPVVIFDHGDTTERCDLLIFGPSPKPDSPPED